MKDLEFVQSYLIQRLKELPKQVTDKAYLADDIQTRTFLKITGLEPGQLMGALWEYAKRKMDLFPEYEQHTTMFSLFADPNLKMPDKKLIALDAQSKAEAVAAQLVQAQLKVFSDLKIEPPKKLESDFDFLSKAEALREKVLALRRQYRNPDPPKNKRRRRPGRG